MSHLTPEFLNRANPILSCLACVHCARSKARCDRKVPCSRCVGKKLTCQTRDPQRRTGRSALNNRSKEPISTNANYTANDPVESGGDNVSANNGDPKTATPYHPASSGIYMDWSHSVAHNWGGNRQKIMSEVAREEHYLTRFIAAVPSADESFPRSIPLSSNLIQPGIPPTNEHFDLAAPTTVLSPTSQLIHLVGIHSWDLEFPINENDAMDGYLPTASSSTSLDGGIANDAELQALEGWPLFQCNPVTPSSACVPTVANHVKNLSALLGDGNMIIHEHQPIDSDVAIESLLTSTREKLSASLQGLYKEAQELYGLRGRNNGKLDHNGASVLTLPSPPVWEFLFCACLRYCEPYYPFIPTATLKINERMEGRNTILPSILLLLMLSIGAMAAGESEISPKIAHGLVEICRISLRRLIEQDIKLASNHEVSQCALLNIIASAWSGDKWQMDIAHYQKSMFLEMHLKAEHHVHRDAQVARLEGSDNVAHSWEIWKEQERANRTTHSWLILDHDICLFQDIPTTSFLSSTSLNTPIPSLDATWNAQSINHWIEGIPSSSGHIIIPPSLDDWIRWFSDTNDISSATHISPITLRLLLCDLQNQVIYLRANIDKSQGPGQTYRNPQNLSIVLIPVQMQSVQELLRKWYDLAKTHRPSKKICPATASNMILYHLIMLNAVVSFPQIEHLARSSPENDTGSKSPRFHGFKQPHHLENTREIYFHCGQVLRHVQSIPEPTRPPWWAGSVYRIALIAWANGMVCTGVDDVHHEGDIDTQTTLFLDALPPDHASIMAYLNHQGGIPAFSGSNGAMVLLGNSVGVIRYCAHFLNTNIKASVTLGIHRKLLAMAQRWESETPQYLGSGWRPHAFHDDMTI